MFSKNNNKTLYLVGTEETEGVDEFCIGGDLIDLSSLIDEEVDEDK